jgi:hypothetical protein
MKTLFHLLSPAPSVSSLLQLNAQGNLFLDDISVEPAWVGVPEGGTTVSLLGFASLGLVALRRRLSC